MVSKIKNFDDDDDDLDLDDDDLDDEDPYFYRFVKPATLEEEYIFEMSRRQVALRYREVMPIE